MNNELKSFLDSLKPGDTVDQIVRGTWGPPRIERMTVAKRTATQIVMTCGTRFREYDGSVVGRSIYGSLRCPLPLNKCRKSTTRTNSEAWPVLSTTPSGVTSRWTSCAGSRRFWRKSKMTEGRTVRILLAGNVGDIVPPKLTIEVSEQIHDVATLEEARELHARQGSELADAIMESMPGGTVDALLAELMRRRASLFSVPLP